MGVAPLHSAHTPHENHRLNTSHTPLPLPHHVHSPTRTSAYTLTHQEITAAIKQPLTCVRMEPWPQAPAQSGPAVAGSGAIGLTCPGWPCARARTLQGMSLAARAARDASLQGRCVGPTLSCPLSRMTLLANLKRFGLTGLRANEEPEGGG